MVNESKNQESVTLSMIVPVYGVEAYIHRFLESITKNLHDGLEVILVNDGSKDRCGDILDAYQEQYPQAVRVIHKKNGGVSSARNAGMAVATGEYLLFADPDDYLEEHYTEIVLDAIEKYHRPDMILFDYYRRKREQNTYKKGCDFAEGNVEYKQFLGSFAQDHAIKNYLWHKVIKRSICEGVSFDETIHLCEDAKWLTDVTLAASSIVYVKKAIYYYEIREGSLSRAASYIETKKILEIFLTRCERYREVLGSVSLSAPLKVMVQLCVLRYRGGHCEDISYYEDFIRKNAVKALCGGGLNGNEKKRILLIALGLGKYYYRKK